MGGLSIWHILILAIVIVLIMGRGKISELMGDVARGIKNFREGLKDERAIEKSDEKKDEAVKR
ncbi:MAG: twin-arginine translocase TatA/TatE family subunit [Alphaproteobacteria bacterium]